VFVYAAIIAVFLAGASFSSFEEKEAQNRGYRVAHFSKRGYSTSMTGERRRPSSTSAQFTGVEMPATRESLLAVDWLKLPVTFA
jgi:hypothetical protein